MKKSIKTLALSLVLATLSTTSIQASSKVPFTKASSQLTTPVSGAM